MICFISLKYSVSTNSVLNDLMSSGSNGIYNTLYIVAGVQLGRGNVKNAAPRVERIKLIISYKLMHFQA